MQVRFEDPGRGAFRGLRPGLGGVEVVLEDRAPAACVEALVARQTHVQTCGVAGDRDVREAAGDVITQSAFSTAVGAEPERLAWCGFDDGDVLVSDPGAGDVDAEFEGPADDIGYRT